MESLEVLPVESSHHRRDLLLDVLTDALLVLRTSQRAELEELTRFLQLEPGERPIPRLRCVVELPYPVADFRHEAREPRLHGGELLTGELAALSIVECDLANPFLEALLVGHRPAPPLVAANREG